MSIGESTVRISRLQRKVIKSCEGLLGDTTKFPDHEAGGLNFRVSLIDESFE